MSYLMHKSRRLVKSGTTPIQLTLPSLYALKKGINRKWYTNKQNSAYESSFIQLLDKITNGSTFVINEAGTGVFYRPGILIGGTIEHDCCLERGIGYFLEALLVMVPFTKNPTKVVFRGVTNNKVDPSVDLLKYSSLPVLKKFLGFDEGLDIKITRRGAASDGGGEVIFTSPCRDKLRPINFVESGRVKRIRGVAWATRVSPAICNRLVESARSILNRFLSDIYFSVDHRKGKESGKSPGFGMTLVAETMGGSFLCAEVVSNKRGEEPTVPEDLGKEGAILLMDEIARGGCVDSSSQCLAVTLMTLGEKDVSKLKVGALSPSTVDVFRHINDFFNVMFKIDVEQKDEDDEEKQEIMLRCVGSGYRNIAKVTL